MAPTNTQLKQGDLVSVDICSKYKNYIGDMFRVYSFGKTNGEILRIHKALDEVNRVVIESIKPGMTASDLYYIGAKAMRDKSLDMALEFIGHGIGLDVHEPPWLILDDSTILQTNMALVIEVATRKFELGHFCAEIPVLLTDKGCEVLSSIPYTLTVVE